MEDLQAQVASIGALAEPTRLALYRYVAGATAPVSREQAAAAVDLPLHSVKFHLDRLVEEGLLEVEYRRLTGRTGPGAGRPVEALSASRAPGVGLAARATIRPRRRGPRCSRRAVGARRNTDRRGGAAGGARHRLKARQRADRSSPSKPRSIHRESRRRARQPRLRAPDGRRRRVPDELSVRPARRRTHRPRLWHEPRPGGWRARRPEHRDDVGAPRTTTRVLLREGRDKPPA